MIGLSKATLFDALQHYVNRLFVIPPKLVEIEFQSVDEIMTLDKEPNELCVVLKIEGDPIEPAETEDKPEKGRCE